MGDMMRYHVRRTDKEITDEAVMKKMLKSAKYVTIAMSLDDRPYLVSLSHGYDEDRNSIYFHCAEEGKKLDYMRSNSTVWGQALLDLGYSEGACTHIFASVHFQGKVTLLEGLDEKRRAMECMMRHLDGDPEPMISRLTSDRLNGTAMGRIDIEYMSGKKSDEVTL